jgi:hypothetical protein
VTETKPRELLFPRPDDIPEDQLPEPIELTPEQLAAEAAEEQRDRQRRLDWAITQALNDNSMAVFRPCGGLGMRLSRIRSSGCCRAVRMVGS